MKSEIKLRLFLYFPLVLVSFGVNAQTLEEARQTYDSGIEAAKEGNISEAINLLNSSHSTCQILEEKQNNEIAGEIKLNIQKMLPNLYLRLGSMNYQSQQLDEALQNTTRAKELAIKYSDTETAKQAKQLIPQIHYKIAVTEFKNNNISGALDACDKAVEADAGYTTAYYFKAVILRREDDPERFKLAVNNCIVACKKVNDTITLAKITDYGFKYFLWKGTDTKGTSKFDEAIGYYGTALSLQPEDAMANYLLATTYLSQEKLNEAIAAAEKAVLYEKGGDEAKAKIYMLVAEANAKKGDINAACTAYKKAAVGQYAESANYQITFVLKCR